MPKSFTRVDDKGLKVVNADLKAWADASAQQIDDSEVRASFAEVKAAVESAAKEPAPNGEIRGHVMSAKERERLWWEVTLDLKHWVKSPAIELDRAAMVLCGFNPLEMSLDDALASRERGDPLSMMLDQFRWHEKVFPEPCTLRQWLQVAKQKLQPVHPGVAEYLESSPESKDTKPTNIDAVSATPKPVGRQSAQDEAILNALKDLGYENRLFLPKAPDGQQGVRAQVRKKLENLTINGRVLFPKESKIFGHAWDRFLSENKRLKADFERPGIG